MKSRLRTILLTAALFMAAGPPIGLLIFLLVAVATSPEPLGGWTDTLQVSAFVALVGFPISYLLSILPAGIAGSIVGAVRVSLKLPQFAARFVLTAVGATASFLAMLTSLSIWPEGEQLAQMLPWLAAAAGSICGAVSVGFGKMGA